jgi:hypothetical protein
MISKSKSKSAKNAPETKTSKPIPVAAQSGPVIVDGYMHFSQFDLTRYELAQAKVVNAAQADRLKRAEGEQARRNYEDTIRKLNDELALVVATGKVAESELRALQKELEELYQLDFSQVTYDDRTGKISVLGSPVPED